MPRSASPRPAPPTLRRAVGRWQLLALSLNDVIGSGIYLLPAAAAAVLGLLSVGAVLLAGVAVGLLVLTYAQAASHFEREGGSYLYAREAFGPFIGFEVGWMLVITRIVSAAALANGLADAVSHFWPQALAGGVRGAIVVGSLLLLGAVNAVGVRAAARFGVALALIKLVPLLLFIAVGVAFVDLSGVSAPAAVPLGDLGKGALLLLFAFAGFENLPAAASEYRNPRRDVPFALVGMITIVTALYVAIQWVALGTLPGLATATTPLVDAAARFGGTGLAVVLTVGAAISILGTSHNTILFGPRYLHALAEDGWGPAWLARVHPRWRTPAAAVGVITALSVLVALSGSFVQLALLSVVARLSAYLSTTLAVLVLRRRPRREGVLELPGGPLIPLLATLLALALLGSAGVANLVAGAVALALGALVYRWGRRR